jgi:hypothetical protein
MSFNHLKNENIEYRTRLGESVDTLEYILSPFRYEHADKRRHNLGIIGGPAVSHIRGNLVDLESDLRCQTRLNTHCVEKQYKPLAPGQPITNDKTKPIDTALLHLPSLQMISYRSVPFPPSISENIYKTRQ